MILIVDGVRVKSGSHVLAHLRGVVAGFGENVGTLKLKCTSQVCRP